MTIFGSIKVVLYYEKLETNGFRELTMSHAKISSVLSVSDYYCVIQ